MNKQEITQSIKMLASAGLRFKPEINSDLINTWTAFFQNEDSVKFNMAIFKHIEEKSEFPTIADIKAIIKEMSQRKPSQAHLQIPMNTEIEVSEDEAQRIKVGTAERLRKLADITRMTKKKRKDNNKSNHMGYISNVMRKLCEKV